MSYNLDWLENDKKPVLNLNYNTEKKPDTLKNNVSEKKKLHPPKPPKTQEIPEALTKIDWIKLAQSSDFKELYI